jgi:hypothetical protein
MRSHYCFSVTDLAISRWLELKLTYWLAIVAIAVEIIQVAASLIQFTVVVLTLAAFVVSSTTLSVLAVIGRCTICTEQGAW